MSGQKVLIIGLDGATFELLLPWLEKRKLPNLSRIYENGAWGVLESTIPPLTLPAWAAFATGCGPARTGCYGFSELTDSLAAYRFLDGRDIARETFYETLERDGKSCILINLPGSYPPRTQQITITSLETRQENCVYPPELKEEIPELAAYRIAPNVPIKRSRGYVQAIREVESIRFDCAQRLFARPWDLFFILFSATDWVQHVAYGELLSGKLLDQSPFFQVYQDLDNYVGWFLQRLPGRCSVLVVSDHGFHAFPQRFNMDQWLKQEGYLHTTARGLNAGDPMDTYAGDLSGGRTRHLLRQSIRALGAPVVRLLEHAPLLYQAAEPVIRRVRRVVPISVWVEAGVDPALSTAAFSPATPSGIYLNTAARFHDGIVQDRSHYLELRQEIREKLEAIRRPGSDEPVFQVCYKEEVYAGPFLSKAPDLVVFSERVAVGASSLGSRVFENRARDGHSLQGIFMAMGPHIKPGPANGARIVDIAPTILHLLGTPLPQDLDGRVLTEILQPEVQVHPETLPAVPPPGSPSTPTLEKEGEKLVEQRLRQLGYL